MDDGSRDELLSRLAEAVGSVTIAHPTRVAIDGPPAAGKTTLADELAVVQPATCLRRASASARWLRADEQTVMNPRQATVASLRFGTIQHQAAGRTPIRSTSATASVFSEPVAVRTSSTATPRVSGE